MKLFGGVGHYSMNKLFGFGGDLYDDPDLGYFNSFLPLWERTIQRILQDQLPWNWFADS